MFILSLLLWSNWMTLNYLLFPVHPPSDSELPTKDLWTFFLLILIILQTVNYHFTLFTLLLVTCNWDSTTSIATCYRLNSPGFKLQWRWDFPGPPSPHTVGYWVSFPKDKAAGAWHWPLTPSWCRGWVLVEQPLSPLCACLACFKTPFYLCCCYQVHLFHRSDSPFLW